MSNPWKYLKYGLITVGTILGITYLTGMVQAAEVPNYKAMTEQMFEPTVQLGQFCSGTLIYSERDPKEGKVTSMVLTAKHCVSSVGDEVPVNIASFNKHHQKVKQMSYRSTVWGISFKSDLALLKLKDEDTYFLNVAKVATNDRADELLFGEPVYNVSFPLGGNKTYTTGTFGRVESIDAFSSLSQSKEFFRATPDVAPASSGSPLFAQNDKGEYELIGTLTGGALPLTFITLYTPTYEINEYLDVAKKSYEVKDLKVEDLDVQKN